MKTSPIDIIRVPAALSALYAVSDKERFPSFGADDSSRPSSLYYADFKVAEAFGFDAVKDTYKRCGDLASLDPKMATELFVVANHLVWEHHYAGEDDLAMFYQGIDDAIHALLPSWPEEMQVHLFEVTD